LLLELPFVAGPSHRVESAQRNAITSLGTLFVTPSLRAQFVSHAPVSPWLSGGFGYGLYEGSSTSQNGVANTEIHRNVATSQFGGESMSAPGSNWCSRSASKASFWTSPLSEPSLGVLVQRSEQHNLVVSGGLVCPFLAGCGEDIPLVNMEDRMLDRFADHQS